jgi:hypothetical protein
MVHQRLIETLLCALALTLPLYIVGVPLGGFDFSAATFILMALGGVMLVRGRLLAAPAAAAALFMAWCLFTAMPRHPVGSYLLSWLGLGVVLLPLCGALPKKLDTERVFRAFVYGGLLSLGFAAYEVGVAVAGLPAPEQLFSFGLWDQTRTHDFLGLRRVKATFQEPAHYARYLVLFLVIVVEARRRRGFEVPYGPWVIWLVPVALLATLSLSGVVLMMAYGGASLAVQWHRWIRVFTHARVWIGLAFGLLALEGALQASDTSLAEVVGLFVGRLVDAWAAVRFGIAQGSEGSRITSSLLLFDFVSDQGPVQRWTGVGYAHVDTWLRANYGYLGVLSSISRGDLHNTFSLVTLSTGLVGLTLYLVFLWQTATPRRGALPATLVVAWLVAQAGTGFLIGYQMWATILLARAIFAEPARDPRSPPPEAASSSEATPSAA